MRTRCLLTYLLLLLPSVVNAANVNQATLTIPAEQRTALGIEVAPATQDSANTSTEMTAKVILPPASVRVIAAPADGLITALRHQTGEPLKAGDKVVTLSSPEIVEAQRQYLQAQLKYQLATDNASRERPLAEQGLIAKNTWRLTENEVKLAKADVDAAQATLQLLGVKPGSKNTEVTLSAPISGQVIETLVEPGQRVEAPAALVKIANLRQLALEIPLTPDQAKHVQVGQKVTVEDGQASGKIRVLQPALDAAQNVILRADIEQNDIRLYPGQNVKVTLQTPTSQQDSLSIPASGVVWQGDKALVFVETSDGFSPTPITILSQNEHSANINGLSADSRIAVKGVAALKAKWQETGE